MAELTFEGLDEFALSMQEIAELPDETVYEMLDAEAEIVVAAQKKKIESIGLVRTGKFRDSIKASHRTKNGQPYVSISPRGKNVRHKNRKTGKISAVSNNEIGFIYEFGAPRRGIHGWQWMHLANEGAAEAATEAAAAVYDRFLKSKNL